ncbi:GntR family transcriptional regulator [Puniceicoccus vermicola]|uniref:GntR family transcriptional regulator n=1 Tax=Puniceicoccus vermicola TaxID=388746 RepID=A0A7X1AZ71_9BACT|nr:GntR family transcriptional regulator [Puniceicoccus vermicola]MBC2602671.1 GntR family transcriptional regulator [Puniceicoccus vermicola]
MRESNSQKAKVIAALEQKLASPDLDLSQALPSETELQRRLGVSRGTVREALSDLERRHLIDRVKGKGTFPRRLEDRSSKPVAFLLREPWKVSNFHNSELLRGMQIAVAEQGTDLLITSRTPGEWTSEFLHSLAGVVVLPRLLVDGDLSVLRRNRIPFCLAMESDLSGPTIVDQIEEAAFALAEGLIRQGHRSIALLSGHFEHSDRLKKRGMARAAEEVGIDFAAWPDYCTNYDVTLAYEICQDILRQSKRPTAIIGFDNGLAVQAIRAAREVGVRVPEALSVVGFGGRDFSDLINPPLSSVNLRGEEAGKRAVQFLYRADPSQVERLRVGYDLVWRESSGNISVS